MTDLCYHNISNFRSSSKATRRENWGLTTQWNRSLFRCKRVWASSPSIYGKIVVEFMN